MMKFLLSLSFLSCDAVSISKANPPTDLITAGGGVKLVGAAASTTVPGAMNGKKWGKGAAKLVSESSGSFSGANWLKRNEILGDGRSHSRTKSATFAQQGKATGQGNGNAFATDDKRLFNVGQTYSDDDATYKIGSSMTGKTLGKTERHVSQNYLKNVGEKYSKNGLTANSDVSANVDNIVNSSHWLYKKGRESFDYLKEDGEGTGTATKDMTRDVADIVAIRRLDDGADMYIKPIADSDLSTWETDTAKPAQFPDVQAKQLHLAATKANTYWRTTDKDAAGALTGTRAAAAQVAKQLSHEEWIKATYQQPVICLAGVWAGTAGCVMTCGYTDDTPASPCKGETPGAIVVGEDANGDASKCEAGSNNGDGQGAAGCGSCLCTTAP